jgi:O-antigen/teichoic acid export membrane protein
MPVSLIGNSIGQVFFQKASVSINNNQELSLIITNLVKKLILIIFIPLGILLTYGDYIFLIVFGKNWFVAGKFAMIISPWMLVHFIAFPLLYLFELLQKQKIFLLFNLILFFLRLISLLIGYFLFNNAKITIIFYAFASFTVYLLMIIYLLNKTNSYKASILTTLLKYLPPIWGGLILSRLLIF